MVPWSQVRTLSSSSISGSGAGIGVTGWLQHTGDCEPGNALHRPTSRLGSAMDWVLTRLRQCRGGGMEHARICSQEETTIVDVEAWTAPPNLWVSIRPRTAPAASKAASISTSGSKVGPKHPKLKVVAGSGRQGGVPRRRSFGFANHGPLLPAYTRYTKHTAITRNTQPLHKTYSQLFAATAWGADWAATHIFQCQTCRLVTHAP
jgi:hypothetical protein